MLNLIEGPVGDPLNQEITPDEAQAGARAIVNLFDNWQLTDEQACGALGNMSARTWARWKQREFGRIGLDLATRLSLLLGIHKSLRIIFKDRRDGYAWIKKPNEAFGGRSAAELMAGGQIFALIRIRRYLDAERGGW